jgi:protein-L-isoaspartate(D-aspartate) O-methyltransferase
MDLVDSLIKNGWLKTARIISAFQKVKRSDFMPENIKALAEIDEAMPIGFKQTISQPLVVAFMLEQLRPEPGDKILDIGSGSGWTSALLAYIVGDKGKIISIEIVPELKRFGERNTAKYNFGRKGIVKFIRGDGAKGYEKEAPYDKILCSAAAERIPQAWREQLKTKGKIVAPVKSSIWVLTKVSEKEFEEKEYPGFAFVPLVCDS